ncbi:CynX/NimT family MFS transporter [Paenibacillus harenae]|uniref:CynX/NimT family MFS transporter n=1 Tax=Paenibacillus harenae TaxID=306543 RepID=UPI002793883A|nr:MFS transporter [Paenibacillus harenae]MDQ0058411.1 CP family cyanate transporter-like MFS transporter [Paenibacillus harenae]
MKTINSEQSLPSSSSTATRAAFGGTWLLIAGILIIAVNLRAPITAVGPIVSNIQQTFGISSTMTGLLTTLPLLAFALISPLAPRIASRIGMETSLFLAMLVLAGAVITRSLPTLTALLAGTVLLGMAIAIANVLLPSLIKRDFPASLGLMTGLFSVVMNLGAGLASGFSIPMAVGLGLGWEGMLASWSLLALIAAAAWLPQVRVRQLQHKQRLVKTDHNRNSATGAAAGNKLLRSALAWQVTLFMGLQSFSFYVNITWLPELLHDRGMSHSGAGWMLFLLQIVSLPATFIVPIIAAKSRSQRPLAMITAILLVVSYLGLLIAPSAWIPLWIMLLGISGGAGFSLAVMFFVLRTASTEQSAELSGMAQSIGYLLAAAGPLLFGLLHDATHDWTASLWMILIVSALFGLAGWYAAADKTVNAQ